MAARAPLSGGSFQAGGAPEPTAPEELEEVQRLLAAKKLWPAFLRAGIRVWGEWNDCPEIVGEALEWVETTALGLLDIARVGPLTPVCKAFTALIEATQGATEAAENLRELISWCAFLVGVFIAYGKHAGDLSPITKFLDEFVATTRELAKRAKVLASRSICAALFCYKKDLKMVSSFEDKLRRVWTDIQGVASLETREIVSRLQQTLQPAPVPVMANIPAAALTLPSTSHVKRVDLLSEVVSGLTATDDAGAPYVLTGIGGGGKTVLASSVVRTKWIREHFRQGISWVRVGRGGKDQLQALLEGIVREVSVAPTIQTRFNSVDDVIQHLTLAVSEEAEPRLVVLDDVWEREVVDTLQATGLQLLVTTRLSSVVAVAGGRTVVGNMSRGEARDLLKKKSGAVALPETEADQVAEACGWHALTLAIAGSLPSVADSPNCGSAWQKLHSEIEQKKSTARGPRMNAGSDDDPTKLSLFPVLDLSLESLGKDEQRLFLSLVVLARGVLASVPMLASIWQKDRRGARREAEFLVDNSLLQEVDGSFRLHDLLLDFIAIMCQGEDTLVKEAVGHQTRYLGNLAVLRGYSEKGQFGEGFYSLISLWRKLVELCGNKQLEVDAYNASLGELGEDESEDTAYVLWAVGRVFELQGKYADVKPLYERSLAIGEKVLGPDHPDVATSLNNLAGLFESQGNYEAAKPLYERSLAIGEKVLGPEHPHVAASLNNLAALLESQGNYEAAKPLYERSLAIGEKVLGPEHLVVGTSLNNLAGLFKSQGNYEAAKPLYERSLAIGEKVLGPDHPDVAATLNNLAGLFKSQGNYEAAKPLYERSLAIGEKVLGPDHPDVAASLNNLAGLLESQGNYEAAKPLYERSLAILEKVLGPDHPHVAASLNNLAGLFKSQGNYEAAKPLYERSLAILEKVLGPDHPHVAASLNNLAGLFVSQGNSEAAKPLFERSLAILEKVQGPDHPDVAASLNNLAALFKSQANFEAAKPLYERSLAIGEKVLGPDHPHVAASLNNLAGLLESQGNFEAAKPLFERSLAIREKVLGPDHPDVAASLNNLAGLLESQGNYEAAKPLYERSLAIGEKVLGPDHPHVATGVNNLAGLFKSLGNYEAAKPLYERSLAILEKVLGPDHPHVAASLNNLAGLFKSLGNYEAAKPLYERSLAIREKVLGPDHPHVGTSLNNLAGLLESQGSDNKTVELLERALSIRTKKLGAHHQHTVDTLNNLRRVRQQVQSQETE
eukprot:g8302.t1